MPYKDKLVAKQKKRELYLKNRTKILDERCKNKEEINRKAREERSKNKKHVQEREKKWYNKNKIRIRKAKRIWHKNNPEVGKKYRLENKEKYREYQKNYVKNKRRTDEKFNRMERLRWSLNKAFKHYSKTGKAYNSKKYGINFQGICEHLGPKPEGNFQIDHIRPLRSFDFDNLEQVREAFAPENHQWLTAEENQRKGGKW